MGIFGGLLKTATGLALSPLGVLSDIVGVGENGDTGKCMDLADEGLDEILGR